MILLNEPEVLPILTQMGDTDVEFDDGGEDVDSGNECNDWADTTP